MCMYMYMYINTKKQTAGDHTNVRVEGHLQTVSDLVISSYQVLHVR